ncbi:MAG: FHA domain-containing protein [Planctomycetota bacterium]|nr:MAG: FHA domain-containing protein [Planctomycetota bacterium]
MAWIEFLGRRVELQSGMVIGRSRKCELHVDDPRASRQHCRLENDDQRWWVVDLGASNPTRRNKQLVQGRMALTHADVITIGNSDITFFDPDQSNSGSQDDDTEDEFDATFLAPAPMTPASPAVDNSTPVSAADSATGQVQAPASPQCATPAPTPTYPHPTPQPQAPIDPPANTTPVWPPPAADAPWTPQPTPHEGRGLRIMIIILIILALILGAIAGVLHFAPGLIS